ncbi:protein-S-isoprenylcysteine O-methyltransferase Ste14 [Planomicrobium stackebrandtii]|uniref:Protein-S-isoprenylcysteine O-methyltransferase Ste14 n=1 Tax=Planomicrobium stackebrandtii TaxID=253160 RepID=A0ABU0GWB7_9BACL|nr:hypothetical protein [Planomicrobium stackebrandtii]MDQ0429676.1 protein-S-isoprenylcysteine O-methyltransferase Ste14 [Planomicrobium stackebrandtii]
MLGLSFIFAIGFVLIHLFSKRLKLLKVLPRSRFLSVAGGISVAYVFLHLLPELSIFQDELQGELENSGLQFLENHIYVIAMAGLVIFYALEHSVKTSKKKNKHADQPKAATGVFWVHIVTFALYNSVISYLLVREEYGDPLGMFLFFIAMGVHFITNDKGLRATHQEEYDRYGRWLLAAAILVGWATGAFADVHEWIISVLTAFLAGGVILNVLKEELPEERESSLVSFCVGLTSYSILLLFL